MKQHSKLYKKDSTGNTRVWYIEEDNNCYRPISGVLNGKLVEHGWIYPEPKNVGKSNETTIQEQMQLEIASEYEYQLNQGKYHKNIKDVDKGANYVVPMLAVTYDEKKHNSYPYIADGKLDGARFLGYDNIVQTRTGKQYISVPHINEAVAKFSQDYPGFILDGELYNHELKDDFETIMSLIKKTKNISAYDIEMSKNQIKAYVYDIIPPYSMTAHERKEWLDTNVKNNYPFIIVNEWGFVKNKKELDERCVNDINFGFEGTMLRSPRDYYKHKRDKALIKVKTFQDIEAEVLDIQPGTGVWSGCGKIVTIRLPSGNIQNANIVGNFEQTKKYLEEKEKYIGGDATVKFQGYTADGMLRFPIVKYLWGKKRDI